MRAALAPLIACLATPLTAQTLDLPPRPVDAPTGSEFVALVTDLDNEAREVEIFRQVLAGNVPDFLRDLVPVTVNRTISGTPRSATYYVTPDVMAIGTDADHFLCPMTPYLAQWLADELDCSMPTRRMSNSIWAAASVHMNPEPIPPSPAMTTVPVFDDHNTMVQTQRATFLGTDPLGALVAGHKKDVVITPRLINENTRVAIYGWHYQTGNPIQPLYLGHVDWYVDYSHGIRMIQQAMTVDGEATRVEDVLADPVLHPLLSDEGAWSPARYLSPPPPEFFPYEDSFPPGGRELSSWIDRFTTPALTSFSPPAPGGDGTVLIVSDPSGGIDTTRLGGVLDRDYSVSCDIYCEYRANEGANGGEFVGIFARDDGNGLFDGSSFGGIPGNCYALTYSSMDGQFRCLRVVDGVGTNLLTGLELQTTSGWRRFRIDCFGDEITFYLDDALLLAVTDTTHATGQFGIGYREAWINNASIHGTRADNFLAVEEVGGEGPSAVQGLFYR